MTRRRTEGENFSVDTPLEGPAYSEISGVVSGEIGKEEEPRPTGPEEALARIEADEGRDPLVAALFEHIVDEDPHRRIERLLDEINSVRRSQQLAPERDAFMSRLATRLRELL